MSYITRHLVLSAVFAQAALSAPSVAWARHGELELRAVDHDTGEPLAVRMHLKNVRGRRQLVRGLPIWHDHFTFDGNVILKLPSGQYTFEMEHGPEYRIRTGHFTINPGATDNKQVDMHRFIDMAQAGWWSGDLHVQRPIRDTALLMRAEDLHVLPLITWSNEHNLWANRQRPEPMLVRLDEQRFYQLMAGRDRQSGGTLLFFQLPKAVLHADAKLESPSPMDSLKQARQFDSVHVDLETPFAWDVPLWIATRNVDTIGLANGHLWRHGIRDEETAGMERDRVLYPAPHGIARWGETIYYHLLNCGLAIPPSAGSGSGIEPNPVGYNRVYVHCDGELTYEKWWQNLRRGRVFVTNGPLLQPQVNGQPPGHVFRAYQGETLELNVSLHLATRDKIDYLEIIKNGDLVHQVRLDQWAAAGGKLPPVNFRQSGWLLARVITNNNDTYRFASTGPYYVHFDNRPRISRRSAQFFLDWIYKRARQVRRQNAPNQQEVLNHYRDARDFWRQLVETANAE